MPRWHIKPDPLGYPRHGLVVYLLALCVLSGVTLLFGRPAAGSLEAALDPQIVVGWAFLLTLGATFALVVIGTFRGEAMLIGGILLGFAYACFHTWRRINQRINEILEQSS